MAAETANIRNLTRRVKQKALEQAELILNDPDHKIYSAEIYNATYQTVLKNAVPQTREITGEEGEAIKISFDKVFENAPTTTRETTSDSSESSPL